MRNASSFGDRNYKLLSTSRQKVTQRAHCPCIDSRMATEDDISERIRSARISAGFASAAEAARRLGMEAHAYRHYESGSRVPPTSRLPDIAKLFKVSLEWLITGKGNRETAEVIDLWDRMPQSNRKAALSMLRSLSDKEA